MRYIQKYETTSAAQLLLLTENAWSGGRDGLYHHSESYAVLRVR
jgi:hypothetical protein